MLSRNEWDPLKTVIVGRADDAQIPWLDPSLRLVNYAHIKDIKEIHTGRYPQQVIDEANEDLATLEFYLNSIGVEVLRPDNINYSPKYYNYCPRDTVLVYENTILATPTPIQARQDEYMAMRGLLEKFGEITVTKRNQGWDMYNSHCIGNPNILALYENQPLFDAANILRANDDIFYLVSNSGNNRGAEYLHELFPDKRVHALRKLYSYMHLDSTIAFLREGLMLLNPSRIKSKDELPSVLHSWDAIWCPEPVDIGHYPGYCNASTWINMNLLSVNPNLVILEEHQENLRIELERYDIDCVMLPMRHARTLGGCFHCVTLDVVRDHS